MIEILVCRFGLHMQSWGNLWAIFLLVTLGSATFSAFGLIVASVTNTMQETQMINNLIWMGFLFLSGATVPLAVSRLDSARCAFHARHLSGHWPGSATTNSRHRERVLTDVVALAIGLLVAFEISRQLFRWEPEAKVPGRAKLWVLAAHVRFWFSAPGRMRWRARLLAVDALKIYQTISGRDDAARSSPSQLTVAAARFR